MFPLNSTLILNWKSFEILEFMPNFKLEDEHRKMWQWIVRMVNQYLKLINLKILDTIFLDNKKSFSPSPNNLVETLTLVFLSRFLSLEIWLVSNITKPSIFFLFILFFLLSWQYSNSILNMLFWGQKIYSNMFTGT